MILTVAVPAYNMESVLERNLLTYADPRLAGKVEVIVLNNSSADRTGEIAWGMERRFPHLFVAVDKQNNGYGSSVNRAIEMARGTYFRVIDADDWVDTEALVSFVDALAGCEADVVQNSYRRVFPDREEDVTVPGKLLNAGCLPLERGAWEDFLPCLHSTTYRTALLRESGFRLQENMFFVDEEYVTLPFARVNSVAFLPMNVYRYRLGQAGQSTSPANRANYYKHRAAVIARLLKALEEPLTPAAEEYVRARTGAAVKDHLTTLLIYLPHRREGRRLAGEFLREVGRLQPGLAKQARKKYLLLQVLNRCHISLEGYLGLKQHLLHP